MKFNSTYTSKRTLRESVIDVSLIRDELISHIKKTFNSVYIASPLFLDEESELLIESPEVTRSIHFDESEEYRVNEMLLSNSNWLRSIVEKMELKDFESVYTETQSILRDIVQIPSQPIGNNELCVQIKLPKDEDFKKYVKDLTMEIYDLFYSIIEKFSIKYQETNIYPESAKMFSAQYLETEMSNLPPQQKEMNKLMDEEAILFAAAGAKMFSNKVHRTINPAVYDLKNYYEILFKDDINNDVVNVCSIAVMANGQTLEDQVRYYKVGSILEKDFYSKLAKQEDKVVELKINISKLAMIILKKGHIGEVQAGVVSKETKIISSKNKIEII